jgi:hypothetical protein
MNSTVKIILIWLFAIVLTLASAVYQRMTGPTHPLRGKAEIGGQTIKYRLIRSYNLAEEARVTVIVPDTAVKGEIKLRRFKSYDKWEVRPMQRNGDTLFGFLPQQPPAGKVMYEVTLIRGEERTVLSEHPAILRYTGFVPDYILIPHIFFMFFAMLFSAITGLVAIFRAGNTYLYAWITVIFLAIGGMFLGPVVQKYAFDAYWTGWPFGHDLTDNKSLVAFIIWLIALYALKKNRENRLWPVVASVVLLAVFMIPHSTMGSEIDFTKEEQIENKG